MLIAANFAQLSVKETLFCAILMPETSTGSEFLSFFDLYSRLLADFLSHLGKWVKLIKFEAKNEFFCTWKVEKPQSTTSSP